jgi:hypothetical protein
LKQFNLAISITALVNSSNIVKIVPVSVPVLKKFMDISHSSHFKTLFKSVRGREIKESRIKGKKYQNF